MKYYSLSSEETDFVQNSLDKFFIDFEPIDFTGTTISPYNLREMLIENGFKDSDYDNNSMEYWWCFSHFEYGIVTMYFNAESFELVLSSCEE